VQQMLQVYQPDFGQLLSGHGLQRGEADPLDTLNTTQRAEAEGPSFSSAILDGHGVTGRRSPAGRTMCCPVRDWISRIRDWRIKIQGHVADNASCGVLVLGGNAHSLRGLIVGRRHGGGNRMGVHRVDVRRRRRPGLAGQRGGWLANTLGSLGIQSKPAR